MQRILADAVHDLDDLEAEAIHIIRETVGACERPAMLFSGGKDSVVMAHLAERAFAPAPIPFPLLQIDTGVEFPEALENRDRLVSRLGVELIVASVDDAIARGVVADDGTMTRNRMQTATLLDALARGGFTAAFGGGRRDEERARAKERVFSHRLANGAWDPHDQRPELWQTYNTVLPHGGHFRVFPLSNWTELSVWRYIERESIEVPAIYYAHERDVLERDGMLYAHGEANPARPGETVQRRWVRFRTVGDVTVTGCVPSRATTLAEIVAEVAAARITERGATRADDRFSEAAMEDRKREGYF